MSRWWRRRPKCQHEWTEPRELDCVAEDLIAGIGRTKYQHCCLRCGQVEEWWESNV